MRYALWLLCVLAATKCFAQVSGRVVDSQEGCLWSAWRYRFTTVIHYCCQKSRQELTVISFHPRIRKELQPLK